MRFGLKSILMLTAGVAIGMAALREEPLLSAARIVVGCVAAFVLPKVVWPGLRAGWRWLKRDRPHPTPQMRAWIAIPWVFLVMILGLVALSIEGEAIQFTEGLARWLVPISLVSGTLMAVRRPLFPVLAKSRNIPS